MATKQVLFVGGTGVVGRLAAQWFRQRHPHTAVLIGGRNMEVAARVAQEVGHAQPVVLDLDKPGLGLRKDAALSAVVMLAPDNGLWGLRLAQEKGIPYLSIGNGLVEVGPEIALLAHHAGAAPVVFASHWLAGPAMFLALTSARSFQSIHSIRLGTILDEKDPAGLSSLEDMERVHGAAPSALAFVEGRRTWLSGDRAKGQIQAIDGRLLDATVFSTLDTVSLYAATGAPNIRFDLTTGESSSRRRGSEVASEIFVDIEGETATGTKHERSTMEFKYGAASLTGISVALSLSVALGLEGSPSLLPGLYLPELLADAKWFLDQLQLAGATINSSRD